MTDDQHPWYRRTQRWGQTNLVEVDPQRYDSEWWRQHWQRTRVQGVIVNAGGIVAYYPSRFPLHHRAEGLGERDLYGEVVAAAREEGLTVIARMDSNRTREDFYRAHPDWFTVDAAGHPHRAGPFYVTCVNSPYYREFLPAVLEEIIERTSPDGFADNSWAGLERERICYCENCARVFRDTEGLRLPEVHDWEDEAYRRWVRWNYQLRLDIWDLNNRITRAAGGDHCLWFGMISGDLGKQRSRFQDVKALCERSEIIMLDHQRRSIEGGFGDNAEAGKRLHGMLGWDKCIPESTAHYAAGYPTFRLSSMPEPEVRLWAVEGWAGGIQPWWHHIGAQHEDRRQYRTSEPLFRWHEENERYLLDRRPLARVGVVWSQDNADAYGRDQQDLMTTLPYRGVSDALTRARIPFLPVHADHIERDAPGLAALVLPDVAALSDEQCAAVRAFVERGGGLFATGRTSQLTEDGRARADFGLADLLGVNATGRHVGSHEPPPAGWESFDRHTYLRLDPPSTDGVPGPRSGTAPDDPRHPVLAGFEETDILPFGGLLQVVTAVGGSTGTTDVPLTVIPAFPIYPPETSWMQEPRSDVPALVLRETAGGRVAYMAADVDRCLGRHGLPDHARLLANVIRWVAADDVGLEVRGDGLLDCQVYQQEGRTILHLVNLTGTVGSRGPVSELVPVGPLQVRVPRTGDTDPLVHLLVAGENCEALQEADGWVSFTIPRITDHEVVVVQ